LNALLDSIVGLLALSGELLFAHSRDARPVLGACLVARNELELPGQDRRLIGAQGFTLRLPRGARVRVETLAAYDPDSVWLHPLEPELLNLVPIDCRQAAAAHGFLLEVPAKSVREWFQLVSV